MMMVFIFVDIHRLRADVDCLSAKMAATIATSNEGTLLPGKRLRCNPTFIDTGSRHF
jgi:hypothetical protein